MFEEISYRSHEKEYILFLKDQKDIAASWFQEDTIDSYRHSRMYRMILPLLQHNKNTSWLTIGDGRFGLDSIRLKKLENTISVLPTDLSSYLLEESKKLNYISEYKVENAEKLSFENNSFDITFCKESYHHFPRPFIALYEMIRVSRKAIVLIEPLDEFPGTLISSLILEVKGILKKILGKETGHRDKNKFEASGNYVYSLSRREIEKVALGLNLPFYAFKEFNDHYVEGGEFIKSGTGHKFERILKRSISRKNLKSRIGIKKASMCTVVIYKTMPDKNEINSLKKDGYITCIIPGNPYLNE